MSSGSGWHGNLDSGVHKLIRSTLGPLFLIVSTMTVIPVVSVVLQKYDGEPTRLIKEFNKDDFFAALPMPTWRAVQWILSYVAFEAFLLSTLPGRKYKGPKSVNGTQPEYVLNAIPAFFVSFGVAFILHFGGIFKMSQVYHHFPELLVTAETLAFVFCVFLYFKGWFFPSTPDVHFTGNVIFDFFQGVELYPSLFGMSVKQLLNCRVSMMLWALVPTACAFAQYEIYGYVSLSMAVSASLMVSYMFKFFVWEGGYFKTIDIMHDRMGYYICWGVSSWVPTLYCLQWWFLVRHPIELGWVYAIVILISGLVTTYVQYDIDLNRQIFRDTDGRAPLWGEQPKYIEASYHTADGIKHRSLLLISGGWDIARHFNYTLELGIAFFWTAASKFEYILPWCYLIFLTILLVDRARRDERRCSHKYGHYWKDYVNAVPYSLFPGLY